MIPSILRRHPRLLGALAAASLLALLTTPAERSGKHATASVDRAGVWRDLDEVGLHEDYVEAFAAAAGRLRSMEKARGATDPETLSALQSMALVAHLGGDQDMAEEGVEMALRSREGRLGLRHPRTIESLVLRGLVAKYANDIGLAEQCYGRAMAALSPHVENLPLLADAMVGRAHLLRVNHGAPGDVVRWLRRALDLRRQAGESSGLGLADNMVWLGWSLLNEGRHDEAGRALQEAEDVLLRSGLESHSLMGTTLTCEADLCVLRGEYDRAESLYGQGLAILERSREGYLPGFGRRKLSLRGYDDLATVQLLRGGGEEAWRSLQKLRNNVSLDLATLSRWRSADAESYERARALDSRLSALEPSTAPHLGRERTRLASLIERAETLASLRRIERTYIARERPGEVTSDELRAGLPPRTAYIGWLHSRLGNRLGRSSGEVQESAWIYVLRPDAPLRWIPLWEARGSEEVDRRIDALATCHQRYQEASDWPLRVAVDRDLDRAARDVWNEWLAPAMPHLEGVDRLIVEYSGEFPRIPIESLIDGDGRPVGGRFACAYVPSATTYLWLAHGERMGPLARRPALALGGAIFSRVASPRDATRLETTVLDPVLLRKALSGDAEALDSLPALPYSRDEAQTVASLFPRSLLLTGARASERHLGELARLGRLSGFGVVHLATHMLTECHPERSAFALSRLDLGGAAGGDGLLRSREVLNLWDLDADLLVLSGCQSARSCGWDDGEYVGFTQAAMAVGARSVVASLWKVDDRATALLMGRFYENLTGRGAGRPAARPLPKDVALAEAKLWLRGYPGADGSRPYAHPVYWAGFVLFGPGE